MSIFFKLGGTPESGAHSVVFMYASADTFEYFLWCPHP